MAASVLSVAAPAGGHVAHTVCVAFNAGTGQCAPRFDPAGRVKPNPTPRYPAGSPFPGDARTPAQIAAVSQAEAVALFGQPTALATTAHEMLVSMR